MRTASHFLCYKRQEKNRLSVALPGHGLGRRSLKPCFTPCRTTQLKLPCAPSQLTNVTSGPCRVAAVGNGWIELERPLPYDVHPDWGVSPVHCPCTAAPQLPAVLCLPCPAPFALLLLPAAAASPHTCGLRWLRVGCHWWLA